MENIATSPKDSAELNWEMKALDLQRRDAQKKNPAKAATTTR